MSYFRQHAIGWLAQAPPILAVRWFNALSTASWEPPWRTERNWSVTTLSKPKKKEWEVTEITGNVLVTSLGRNFLTPNLCNKCIQKCIQICHVPPYICCRWPWLENLLTCKSHKPNQCILRVCDQHQWLLLHESCMTIWCIGGWRLIAGYIRSLATWGWEPQHDIPSWGGPNHLIVSYRSVMPY